MILEVYNINGILCSLSDAFYHVYGFHEIINIELMSYKNSPPYKNLREVSKYPEIKPKI